MQKNDDLVWPISEERIDIIGSNGGEGLHYFDTEIARVAFTDREILNFILTFQEMDLFMTQGRYNVLLRKEFEDLYEESDVSYLDAIVKIIEALASKSEAND